MRLREILESTDTGSIATISMPIGTVLTRAEKGKYTTEIKSKEIKGSKKNARGQFKNSLGN